METREVKLKICRLDSKLLEEYLEMKDSEISALKLRYFLLCLELESLKKAEKNLIFQADEINLLPLNDSPKEIPRLGIGPKSKTELKPMPKSVLDAKLASNSVDLSDFSSDEDDILPEIKLEMEDIEVKSPKKRRGRPKKLKDEVFEHLSCAFCSFIGISEQVLNAHVLENHSDVKREIEDFYQDFYQEENLEEIPKKKKKFSCDKCSYKTDNENLLANHTENRHNFLDLVKCSYCNLDVDRKKMEQHMYSKHKDVKLHICDQCPFKTNSLTNLTRHIDNMHLGTK